MPTVTGEACALGGFLLILFPRMLSLRNCATAKIMRWTVVVLAVVFGAPVVANAQSVPAAIFSDPPFDAAHPAKTTVSHIPSHGVLINGLVYSPPGAGPHPTLVICRGLPGNERNLDLAQAVRRAGWSTVTFNYRGSWGNPGHFASPKRLRMPTPFSRTSEIPRMQHS